MRVWSSALLLGSSALLLAGCPTKADPLACMGSCDHQETKTFCDIDGVYPGTELANECIEPPSADACNRAEPCELVDRPHCSDESMGVCVECLEDEHCGSGEACNQDTNECEVFACTPGAGGDDACAAFDAALPFCADDERCVECLVSDDCGEAESPVCDEEGFACRGCEANAECGSLSCDEGTGLCADEEDIVYVAADGGSKSPGCGSLESPCLTIAAGIAETSVGRNAVVVQEGSYTERLTLGNSDISIIGVGDVTLNPSLAQNQHALLVAGAGQVFVEGITIAPLSEDSTTDAVLCSSGALSLLRSSVEGARDIGIVADNCDLQLSNAKVLSNGGVGITSTSGNLSVSGSVLDNNDGGGISITGSDYSVVNNFITFNGSATSEFGGVRISNAEPRDQLLEFNTVARNQASELVALATNFDCVAATPLVASGNIIYDGFVNGEAKPDFRVVNCSFAFSNVKGGPSGDGNIDEDPKFINAGQGNFHLEAESPCIDAADPTSTLDVDFDGDPRPQGDAPDMGADEAG